MKRILLYVLQGHWNTKKTSGNQILGISAETEPLVKKLKQIKESRAKEYMADGFGEAVKETVSSGCYKVSDNAGSWGMFYISEQPVNLPDTLVYEISREVEEADRKNDIREYIQGLYESENLEPWKYEYACDNGEIIHRIFGMFEKYEDSNISFNATMDNAVSSVLKEISLDDEVLESLWEKFGDVLIDDDERILDNYLGFEAGTHREEVWHWFDKRHSKGVAALIGGM